MSRQSRWKFSGSVLKEKILWSLINVENKCKVSDREFMRVTSPDLTLDGKPVGCGMFTYITKHYDIVNSNPLMGKRIDEASVYEWALLNEVFTEDEVPYDKFTNNTQKVKNKLDDKTLMRMNEDSILGFTQSDVFTLKERKETLVTIIGNERYDKTNETNKKKLLKKVK